MIKALKSTKQKITQVVKKTTKKTQEFTDKVLHGRLAFGPNITLILKQYGDLPITGITIFRHPLAGVLVTAIDTVSGFQFKKNIANANFDTLFHLGMKVTLQGGAFLNLEKTEVISMILSPKPDNTDEHCIVAVVPENLTLNIMLENCKNRMGDSFYTYASATNNCQDFCLALLQANYMNEQVYVDFVKQDTASLFQDTGVLNDVANVLTGLAGRFDVIRRGGAMHHSQRVSLIHHRVDNDFNNKTRKVFNLLSINGKYNVIGSANNSDILYNSDVDLETHTDDKIDHIYQKFKQIFRESKENETVFITDFKCGTYNNEPLRWAYNDMMNGYKTISGHKITFVDALQMKEMVKLDMVVFSDGAYIELSDNYYFKVNGKPLYEKITSKKINEDLKKSANEYVGAGMFYKYLKRVYSLSVMSNNKKNIIALNDYFNSIVGLCWKCASDFEILELLLDCKFRKPNMTDIHSSLQVIKQRLSNCREIEPKSFSTVIDKICDIHDLKLVKNQIHKISAYLKKIVNINAQNFIKHNHLV